MKWKKKIEKIVSYFKFKKNVVNPFNSYLTCKFANVCKFLNEQKKKSFS